MESLRSESIPGLSVITAVFKEGTDIFVARQMLAERLVETAGELPEGVKAPVMTPLTSATMDLLKVGLGLRQTLAHGIANLRRLDHKTTAALRAWGGALHCLRRRRSPVADSGSSRAVDGLWLAISDVVTAAQTSTGVMGAGFVENANQRIVIQTEGQAMTAQDLGETIIAHHDGQSIRLKDVADVQEGPEPRFGDALIQGQPGVLLSMASQYGANTMDVTLAVEAALAEMQPIFDKEGITVFSRLHRPATFIEASLKNIKHSLFLGGGPGRGRVSSFSSGIFERP